MTDDPSVSGSVNAKLVEAKTRWAEQQRALTGAATPQDGPPRPRLPPGQRLTADWPVLDLGLTPRLEPQAWSLSVGGAVEAPLSWNWAQFMDQPQVEMVSDIHCVTTWSRYDNHWRGVTVAHLLAQVRPHASARFVTLRSFDGYSTNLPLADFAAADALLAHSWEGRPLSLEHGGPVRMIVPQLYLWKSAKWLRAITFLDADAPGYWEQRGYHDHGDPWSEERYR